MFASKALLFVALCFCTNMIDDVSASAIPIWERLTQQEKIGQLMYMYLHLVDVYCKESPIPDCAKVLTLYGTSTLVNQDGQTLNTLDPYQRNARNIIWDKITNGAFNFPAQEITNNHIQHEQEPNHLMELSDYDMNFPDYDMNFPDYSDVAVNEPHPYAVRVAPPADFQVPEHIVRSPQKNPAYSLSLRKVSPTSSQMFPHVSNHPYTDSNSFRGQIANLDKPVPSLDFNGLNLTPQFYDHQLTSGRSSARNPIARNGPLLLRILKR